MSDARQLNADAAMRYIEEQGPVLVLALDSNLRVTALNEQARKQLTSEIAGRSFAELLMHPVPDSDLRHMVQDSAGAHLLNMISASGMPESYYFHFYSSGDGWIALGGIDLEEEIRLRLKVLELCNELSNRSRELYQVNRDLRQLNEWKDQFLGMAAHDLRKPLGILLAHNRFVLDEAELNEEHRGYLGLSLRAAVEMRTLIDNFLNLAVIHSGKLRLQTQRIEAASVLSEMAEMSLLLAERKQINLHIADAVVGLAFEADPAKVQQVLMNLVANAIEHSSAGMSVWVSVDFTPGDVIFEVRDEGPGISMEDQKLLFKPFSQASARKTKAEAGSGLGLLIARKIVEAHHGQIWVSSHPGNGARFCFSLPLAHAH